MNYIILILLLVSIVLLAKYRAAAPKVFTPVLYGLFVLVLIIGFLTLTRSSREASQMRGRVKQYNEAAGYRLGQTAAASLSTNAEIVILYAVPSDPTGQLALESQMDGVEDGLGRTNHRITRTAIRMPGLQDDDESDEEMLEDHLSVAQLFAPFFKADAIIYMLGNPPFQADDAPKGLPAFYICNGVDNDWLRTLLDYDIVHAAVVYRKDFDVQARPARGMSVEDIFDLRYRLLTAP